MHALPDAGYNAGIVVVNGPPVLRTGDAAVLRLTIANRSPIEWRHDIPAGRHICIANHWLFADGSIAAADDGRAYLPRTLAPGECVDVSLAVHAPEVPGHYRVEVDLVQERVCWFAEKGSPTARVDVDVQARIAPSPLPAVQPVPRRPSLLQRLRRCIRGGTPTFEMHVISRAEVEETIRAAGGQLLHAIDDNAAGERWLSYTYVCRKS
jgi:hypothetical protein